MKTLFLDIFILLASMSTLGAAPTFSIDGRPITGSFAVRWELDELRAALDIGVNLVFCYERVPGSQLLDPSSETGGLLLERKAKVMANICWLPCGAPLKADIDAAATEIELTKPLSFDEPRTLWIGEEAVRVQRGDKHRLVGCERGWAGTAATAHPKGEHLLHDDLARREVLRIKDSPNLWGYWVIDDKRGNQRGALRALYRIIKELDVDADGKPTDHVVVAGMSNVDALENFGPGVCDMAGIYIYPANRGAYRVDLAANELSAMLGIMNERSPETPFMGIFQAFTGPTWYPKPTPLQLRKQVTDFAHFGAGALMAYSWRMIGETRTLRNLPDLRDEYAAIIGDLRDGRLRLDQPRPSYPARAVAAVRPDGGTLTPLIVFGARTPELKPNPRLTTTYGPGPDGTQCLHLTFDEYLPGRPQWPSVRIDRGHMEADVDWAGAGWLVARVHNYLVSESEVGLSLRDSRGEPWWARYCPLPVGRTSEALVPLSEVRRVLAMSEFTSVSLLMRRPPVATHMAVEGLYLAPPSFELAAGASVAAGASATAPVVDGDASDACWAAAAPVALEDEVLDSPPLRPCSARVVSTPGSFGVLFESLLAQQPLVAPEDEARKLWRCSGDTVELVIAALDSPAHVRCVVGAGGELLTSAYDAAGRVLPPPAARHAATVRDDVWTVELSVGREGLGRGPVGVCFQRHDVQIQHLTWPKSPGTPLGVEAIGRLSERTPVR